MACCAGTSARFASARENSPAPGSEAMKGILGYTEEERVSMDIIGSSYSALVDGASTMVLQVRTAKVLARYDNERGYATRAE